MPKENPDFAYYKTKILSEDEFEGEVLYEKDNGSLLAAFIVSHAYIEAMLLDWISYCGDCKHSPISEEVQNNIDRIGFIGFANIHLLMGNINQELYAKLKKLNTARNSIIHGIRDIKLHDKKTEQGLRKNIEDGIKLYRTLFILYKKKLDTAREKFTLGKSKLGEGKLG